MSLKNVISLMLMLLLAGCYYDVEEELYPDGNCDTADVTYGVTILAILETHCYICHARGVSNGNITLEGYSNLKALVDNGRFLGSIRRDPGFSPMPQNQPRLADCNIAKIEQWIREGARNN